MKYILSRKGISICVTLALLALVWEGIVTHQHLAKLEKLLTAEWNATDTEYQQRADLAAQLVKLAAATPHLDSAATADLVRAQVEVEKIKLDPSNPPADAAQLEKYDAAQAALTKSLFHVVAQPLVHPDLKVSADFRNLSSRLITAQTNIAVNRLRFNEMAQAYDEGVHRFPGVIYAFAFGFRYHPYFPPQSPNGSSVASTSSHK